MRPPIGKAPLLDQQVSSTAKETLVGYNDFLKKEVFSKLYSLKPLAFAGWSPDGDTPDPWHDALVRTIQELADDSTLDNRVIVGGDLHIANAKFTPTARRRYQETLAADDEPTRSQMTEEDHLGAKFLDDLAKRRPGVWASVFPAREDPERDPLLFAVQLLLKRGLIEGSIGGDGGISAKITPRGRRHVEATRTLGAP